MNVNTITSKIISLENELEILRMTIKELFRIKTSKKTENFEPETIIQTFFPEKVFSSIGGEYYEIL